MADKINAYWKKRFTPLKKKIIKHEIKISAILNKSISEPQRTAKFWNGVRSAIHKEYVAIGKLYSKWSKIEIPRAYKTYLRDNMAKVKRLKSISKTAKMNFTQLLKSAPSTQVVNALVQDSISDMAGALTMGNIRVNRLTRLTQQALIDEFMIDTAVAKAFEAGSLQISKVMKRRGTLANQLIKMAKGGRFVSIIDKKGKPRSYRANYYAEMVSRVKFHEAQSHSARVTAFNYGTDLIRVSQHNTTTPICLQYEGKIFSISGKDKRFPPLDQAPPFHVNCLHFLTPTFVEALEAQGKLKEFSQFSKGKTDIHPIDKSWVPPKKRLEIKADTEKKIKASNVFKLSSAKKKRRLLSEGVSEAIGKAA